MYQSMTLNDLNLCCKQYTSCITLRSICSNASQEACRISRDTWDMHTHVCAHAHLLHEGQVDLPNVQ